jgi:uncharacterized protein YeaO (DUF488 family)
MDTEVFVHAKRIYEPAADDDGTRVLVDRLWPRGMTKEAAKVDEWLRDIAPSHELRRWYGHRRERFDGFRERYEAELTRIEQQVALRRLRELACTATITLLTSTTQISTSHVAVLLATLRNDE